MLGFHIPGSFGFRVFQVAEVDGENPLHRLIHQLFVQLAAANRFHDPGIIDTAGRRHFQIQPGGNAGNTVGNRAPVGHHITLKAPFLPKHIGQQPGILRGIDAVDPVVGAHHRPRLRLFHGCFKGGEIDFPQRPLIGVGAGAHAAVLLIVGGKVLDGGAHIAALHTVNIGGRHFTRQIGILRKILKISSAQRGTLDIDSRAQNHAELFMLAAVADGFAHFPDQIPVEGRCRGGGCRHTHSLDAVIDAQVIPFVILLAQTMRAVADHHGGNSQTLDGFGMPKIQTGAQAGLLFQSHLGNQCFNFHNTYSLYELTAALILFPD